MKLHNASVAGNSVLATLAYPWQKVKASLVTWLGNPVTIYDKGFWGQYFGGGSFTGKTPTVDSALQLSTVWACVRLIAETLATLPLGFYQRNPDGSRTAATAHPLYELLHNSPNADMTAVVFWQVVLLSLLMRGNAYIEIGRSGGVIVALNFLHPARMVRKRRTVGYGYEWRYMAEGDSTGRLIREENLMHILAFSMDGEIGLSPVQYGCNVFSSSIETDRTATEVFADALRAPGIVTMDMTLSKARRDEIRAHVKQVSAEGGVYVLEKGVDFKKIGFDPVTMELLATRDHNVGEICRWYGIDPAMVGHGSKDSNWGTGLEQKMIWFLMFALRQWAVRIEQSVRKSLLTPVERAKYFAEFALEGLLRADSAARAAFYSILVQNGIMTRDECRKLENLPPMGGNAEVLTVQTNMSPLDKLGMNQPDAAMRNAMMEWLGIEHLSGPAPPGA